MLPVGGYFLGRMMTLGMQAHIPKWLACLALLIGAASLAAGCDVGDVQATRAAEYVNSHYGSDVLLIAQTKGDLIDPAVAHIHLRSEISDAKVAMIYCDTVDATGTNYYFDLWRGADQSTPIDDISCASPSQS